MSATLKQAWYNLLIISICLITVVSLYPTLGWKANGALGFCGLLGLSPFFFRRRKGEIAMDERDALIQRRSMLLGLKVFWVAFVLTTALVSPWRYGQDGNVPVSVVQVSVFYALILFMGVMSLATIILYRRG